MKEEFNFGDTSILTSIMQREKKLQEAGKETRCRKLTLLIRPALVDELDKIAGNLNTSRNDVINKILEAVLNGSKTNN